MIRLIPRLPAWNTWPSVVAETLHSRHGHVEGMRIRCFSDFGSLRAAHPELAASSVEVPFRSLDWFEHLVCFGIAGDAALQLLSADTPDKLVSCLPLVRQGRSLSSLSNYFTGLYGPIGDDGDAAAWLAVCRYWRASHPRPAIIRLQPLDTESTFSAQIRSALLAAGYWVDSYFCFGNWYLRPNGCSFADYLSGRPAALRNTIRRGRGKLRKAGAWQLAIHTVPGTELEQAISAYEDIYRRSWKPAEEHPEFIRGLCQLAAQRGWLRLGVLSLEGKAIASQIWLLIAGTAHIFKLAYDPAAAFCSPGTVLTAAMMEQAIDKDAATEIDYLSGDDAYKRDWMSHRRERHGLIAFDPATWHGLQAALVHFARRGVKSLRSGWAT